jgi:hypothetical protein
MAGTNPAAVITMEILIEENQISPMWVVLKEIHSSIERSSAVRTAPEEIHQAMLKQQ